MTLDQALEIIEQFSIDHNLDELTTIERMVKQFNTLPDDQCLAVMKFMDATKEPL